MKIVLFNSWRYEDFNQLSTSKILASRALFFGLMIIICINYNLRLLHLPITKKKRANYNLPIYDLTEI